MKIFLPANFKASRWLQRFFLQFLVWYGIALLTLYFFQRNVLYHPDKLTSVNFREQVRNETNGKASVIPGLDAVVLEPQGTARRTAILFHGNGGNGIDRMLIAHQFSTRGYRLILAEYPGYAARSGAPTEQANVADGLALLAYVHRQFPAEPISVVGESLGTGVAVQVAAHQPQAVSELILITPFASMVDVARLRLPMFPVAWLLKDRYESSKHIQQYTGPVRLLVSDKDEVVGVATGLALYQAATSRGSTQLVRVAGAGHNNWWALMSSHHWDQLLGTTSP